MSHNWNLYKIPVRINDYKTANFYSDIPKIYMRGQARADMYKQIDQIDTSRLDDTQPNDYFFISRSFIISQKY